MDFYQHLLADHARQRALMGAILETVARPAQALLYLEKLQEEVAANQAAEEQTLYCDVLSRWGDQVWAKRSVGEHDAITQLIDELTEMDPRFEGWTSGLGDLSERLIRHLDSEEAAVAAYCRSSVGPDCAKALAQDYLMMKSLEIELWGNAIPASERPSQDNTEVAR